MLPRSSPDFIDATMSRNMVRHIHYSADLIKKYQGSTSSGRAEDLLSMEAGASLVKDTRCERYCGEIWSSFQGSIKA